MYIELLLEMSAMYVKRRKIAKRKSFILNFSGRCTILKHLTNCKISRFSLHEVGCVSGYLDYNIERIYAYTYTYKDYRSILLCNYELSKFILTLILCRKIDTKMKLFVK